MALALKTLFDLTGKVAIITGGSRGLGLQIAEALGEFGARVVLVSRKEEELQDAAASLRGFGVDAAIIPMHLDRPEAAKEIAAAVGRTHGAADILVNAAGSTWGAAAEDHPAAAWDKVINLNLSALFFLSQAIAKTYFIPQRAGSIVNLASIEGLQGHSPKRVGTAAYNASKGAVVNLTRALAAEWGPQGIRVNAIAPGFFPTRMTAATLESSGSEILSGTPLGKLGGPSDLKGVALLLASAAGAHITGQTITVDGGATII